MDSDSSSFTKELSGIEVHVLFMKVDLHK